MSKADILVNMSEADLVKLAEIYKQHAILAPQVLNLIKIGMRWKKSEKYSKVFTFMSPNESWKEDGTFITVAEIKGYSFILVFTLDDNCVNLRKGMMETNRLDFTGRFQFVTVFDKYRHVVNEAFKQRNVEYTEVPCIFYSLSTDASSRISLDTPPDVYLKELDSEAVEKVNAHWPYNFEGSADYVAAMIEMNGGYGLYLKSDNSLVAWILQHCYSYLALVQTDEQHKRKGYASFLTKIFSKKLAESGFIPIADVVVYNEPSNNMFEKIGFSRICQCSYYFLNV